MEVERQVLLFYSEKENHRVTVEFILAAKGRVCSRTLSIHHKEKIGGDIETLFCLKHI